MHEIIRSNDLNELLLQSHDYRFLCNFYVVLKVLSLLIEFNLCILFAQYNGIFIQV